MNIRTEQIRVLALSLATGLALTACGGRPNTANVTAAETSSSSSSSSSSGSGTDCTGMVNCHGSSSSTSSSSGGTTLDPALSYSFSLDGTGGNVTSYQTPTFNTDTILKVRITGGPAGPITVPNSNFSMNYYCVGYTVTVLGQTVATKPLAVNGGNPSLCPDTQQVIDFSSRLIPGHGPVSISVTAPRYDYYCELYWNGMISGTPQMYCPLHTVYKTHTVTGQLDVQVNGTTL